MSRPRRLHRRLLGLGAVLLAALAALWLGVLSEPRVELLGPSIIANLHEVDPGRFYRSGQLNLRGYEPEDDWYQQEIRVAERNGVAHHNVRLSSSSLPQPEEIERLLSLYGEVERPILVHCHGGADRAGEASALYQIEYMGRSPEEALAMLSFPYRHLSWLKPAKRYFIERYQGEQWVRNGYEPCDPEHFHYYRARHCRPQGGPES